MQFYQHKGNAMATKAAVIIVGLLAAICLFEAQASTPEKVVLLRCDTGSDGDIEVRNSSATNDTGVSIERGDGCAATLPSLLQAGLCMVEGPKIVPGSGDAEVSFNFVFVGDDDGDCDDDWEYDDDDDVDDDD